MLNCGGPQGIGIKSTISSRVAPCPLILMGRLLILLGTCLSALAQVPTIIHYQGRVLTGGLSFDGTGQFKFALVNSDASQTFWRNAADGNGDGEPDSGVSVPVVRGLYSVLLGD